MSQQPPDETLSSCPVCGALIPVKIVRGAQHVEYHGCCPDHGPFLYKNVRFEMADLGQPLMVTQGTK